MESKTLLIVGGLGAGVLLLVLLSRKSQATQQAAAQSALNAQYASSPAGQVGSILSSLGSFFGSGSISQLDDSYLDTEDYNEPGLITPSSSSTTYANYGPTNSPGLDSSSSSYYSGFSLGGSNDAGLLDIGSGIGSTSSYSDCVDC